MLKIRLMRIGAKKRPFYRVVVVDERAKRTGGYIELLGTYNPLTEPKDIKLKQDRIDYWTKQGAQPSDGFLRIIGKAPKRPPRKPKREKKTEESSAVSNQPSEKTEEVVTTEETKAEETPKEEIVQKDSENSEKPEGQSISEPDDQKSDASETPIQSDIPTTPSPSESSEMKESKK